MNREREGRSEVWELIFLFLAAAIIGFFILFIASAQGQGQTAEEAPKLTVEQKLALREAQVLVMQTGNEARAARERLNAAVDNFNKVVTSLKVEGWVLNLETFIYQRPAPPKPAPKKEDPNED